MPASVQKTVTPALASPLDQRPVDGAAAAPARQERGMEADRALGRDRDHGLRDDQRHVGEHDQLGCQRGDLGADGVRLVARRLSARDAGGERRRPSADRAWRPRRVDTRPRRRRRRARSIPAAPSPRTRLARRARSVTPWRGPLAEHRVLCHGRRDGACPPIRHRPLPIGRADDAVAGSAGAAATKVVRAAAGTGVAAPALPSSAEERSHVMPVKHALWRSSRSAISRATS